MIYIAGAASVPTIWQRPTRRPRRTFIWATARSRAQAGTGILTSRRGRGCRETDTSIARSVIPSSHRLMRSIRPTDMGTAGMDMGETCTGAARALHRERELLLPREWVDSAVPAWAEAAVATSVALADVNYLLPAFVRNCGAAVVYPLRRSVFGAYSEGVGALRLRGAAALRGRLGGATTLPSASSPPAAFRVPFFTRGDPAVGCPGTTGCGSSISSSISAGTGTGSGSGIAGGWNSAPR